MARNVEVKVRLTDIAIQRDIACKLANSAPTIEKQTDFFFHVPKGRLKLRQLSDNSGQLIFYVRPDQLGPKMSEYMIYHTHDPNSLRTVLDNAFGVRGVVRKTREIFMVGRTRIHLDQVEDLGEFLELEVVLEKDEAPEMGRPEAQHLMAVLKISPEDLVNSAYIDLLTNDPANRDN
jgi:predicted adenylyl cyclase CyaB